MIGFLATLVGLYFARKMLSSDRDEVVCPEAKKLVMLLMCDRSNTSAAHKFVRCKKNREIDRAHVARELSLASGIPVSKSMKDSRVLELYSSNWR